MAFLGVLRAYRARPLLQPTCLKGVRLLLTHAGQHHPTLVLLSALESSRGAASRPKACLLLPAIFAILGIDPVPLIDKDPCFAVCTGHVSRETTGHSYCNRLIPSRAACKKIIWTTDFSLQPNSDVGLTVSLRNRINKIVTPSATEYLR